MPQAEQVDSSGDFRSRRATSSLVFARSLAVDLWQVYTSTWLWRWLPHRLSKRQSLTTVLLRTPITQMIFFNQGMLLLGSDHFLKEIYVPSSAWGKHRETQGNKTNWFPKGAVIKCFVIYPFQRMNNLATSYSKKAFLLYKFYNYFPPSDIPSNNENNEFN